MSCPITGEPHCKCDTKYTINTFETTKSTMRKLFTDHAVYTKFYIESALSGLSDLSVLTARLLTNQQDIGDFATQFVGQSNGNLLTKLLKQHILAAAGVIDVIVKNQSKPHLDDAIAELFANSRLVAKFLSTINPHKLPFRTALKEFDRHNQYVIDLVLLHQSHKFAKEIILFDAYYNHMLMFSDILTQTLLSGSKI